jgi:hypothetical protein
MVNPELPHSFTARRMIAVVPVAQTIDTPGDGGFAHDITTATDPVVEYVATAFRDVESNLEVHEKCS